MSNFIITKGIRLLCLSNRIKWQAPAFAAVRHYGKKLGLITNNRFRNRQQRYRYF